MYRSMRRLGITEAFTNDKYFQAAGFTVLFCLNKHRFTGSVQQALQRTGNARLVPIRCRKCKAIITHLRTVKNNNGPVCCLACLPGNATFGQRLKARRLANGLTLMALDERTGIAWNLLSKYERDVVEPKCRSLAKLIRVLGVALMAVE